MKRSGQCMSLTSPRRRDVLLGATALLTIAASRPVRAAERLSIAVLIDGAGRATAMAQTLSGRSVTLAGYLAPPLASGESWQLSEGPAVPCQLCGQMHDIGAAIAVAPDAPFDPVPSSSQAVALTGRLDLQGITPRLVVARIAGA